MPKPGASPALMNKLREIMEQEARQHGAMSFARFMELALYCPNLGYYEREDASPGRAGDYFTSVSVGGVFGELLAFQFARWFDEGLPPGPRQLVEAGAHDGRLAADILNWMKRQRPEIWPGLEYWILEPSAVARHRQAKTLDHLTSKVQWFDSWAAAPHSGVHGVIFSNELFDAMPVHRLGWDAARKHWFEWGVGFQNGELTWVSMPLEESTGLLELLPRLPEDLLAVLPDGFTTEVCPVAEAVVGGRGAQFTARPAGGDRLWFDRRRILPTRKAERHPAVFSPPPRWNRSSGPAGRAGPYRPCQFHRARKGGVERGVGDAGTAIPSAVSCLHSFTSPGEPEIVW